MTADLGLQLNTKKTNVLPSPDRKSRCHLFRRITRTLKRLGVASVAVYSEADAHSLHVTDAGESVLLGPAPVSESYLKIDRILDAAKKSGAQAIHPGYGFLSENADFAADCEKAGLAFIGPTPGQMREFGLKHTARALAEQHGVPLLPGTGLLADAAVAAKEAHRIGYPVMLKSTAGGGGIGIAASLLERGGIGRRLCVRAEIEREQFQGVGHLPGKIRRASASHRSADFWRWQRSRGFHRRARFALHWQRLQIRKVDRGNACCARD